MRKPKKVREMLEQRHKTALDYAHALRPITNQALAALASNVISQLLIEGDKHSLDALVLIGKEAKYRYGKTPNAS